MHQPRRLLALAALLAATTAAGARQAPDDALHQAVAPPPSRQDDAPLPGARSARNANYEIDVRLDHENRRLTGTETIRWRNIGRGPASSIVLHLYWNAWRNNQSSWMRERALAGGERTPREDEWGYIEIDRIELLEGPAAEPGAGERSPQPRGEPLTPTFQSPDDGNPDDRTVVSVALPQPVEPGQSVALRVAWTSRVPRTFSRTGAIGDYYFIAHWFPKVAVFETDRWTAHQFHANTEFFSDYGSYDVRITVPQGWVVGATGTERSRADNRDGTTTHRYAQDDVHDFAWTTSPTYIEHRQRFEHEGLPGVDMRLLLQPEHAGQEDRHFAATAAALRYYGEWYGPYPYPQITIVDPAWRSGAGGMEYPTLFTAGSRWLAPRQSNQPEGVTIHEAGHQFWFGMVGNNEFEDAWLDEGLNTFSEERVQELAFQPNYRVERFFGGFIPWQQRDIALARATDGNGLNGYRGAAERDTPATPTWRYWPGTHAQITYSKTALWLHTLERQLGWETLQQVLATFFERWKFRHPRPEDFFAVATEVSGRDLEFFFDQVYRSSNEFDYAVEKLTSVRVETTGYEGEGDRRAYVERTSDTTYRTTLVVRRLGEAYFPVDIKVRFEGGEEIRLGWDGLRRWQAFTWDRPERAVSAEVDPDRLLLLDVNYTNNSVTLQPEAAPAATRWSMAWMIWLQDVLLTYAFFV
ncbi:MAG: M1 family metallopeptidase [Acidobacteriota bacterium]